VQNALVVHEVELAARLIEPIALPLVFQGQLDTVLGWINTLPGSLLRTCPFLCVHHSLLLTFTNQLQDVLQLLEKLRTDAEAKARLNSVLEILVLRALALEAQGDRTSALSTLERALLQASPEGYIRLFVDEVAPVLALLRQVHARSKVPGYVTTLLRIFGEQPPQKLFPLLPAPVRLPNR
jgi:ATP/maltotriose-dependent transcriptional regulator MalT